MAWCYAALTHFAVEKRFIRIAVLMIDDVKVNLSSGMALSVEIKTGKRRVITYLLSPLQQHTEEALRER